MLHKLAIEPINKLCKPSLSELLLQVEVANRDDTSILTFLELSHLNQIETILIHKQIEYQISQEIRTEQRTAKVTVTEPHVLHWFELSDPDFVFLVKLLDKFKVYNSEVALTKKKAIAIWVELIVDIRRKLLH